MKNKNFTQTLSLCCQKFLLHKRSMFTLTILAIFSLLITAFSPSQQVFQAPNEPSPRSYVAFAYDEESNQIILFGGDVGVDSVDVDHQAWAYDVAEDKWTLMNPTRNPQNLGAATMAYDSESDRVILFGGCTRGLGILSGTWAYDYNTNTWTKMSPGPKNHGGARMVYDVQSDRMILFAGWKFSTWTPQDDTWAYDYNTDTWTEMEPDVHPPARNYAAMTYDATADRVLVSGTFVDEFGTILSTNNMWAYDYEENTWEDLSSGVEEPLSLMYANMAYDIESERSILFGGLELSTGIVSDETWAYDYTTGKWQKMDPEVKPGYLTRHHMVYVPYKDQIYLFGGLLCNDQGCQPSNELWTYDYNEDAWENLSEDP